MFILDDSSGRVILGDSSGGVILGDSSGGVILGYTSGRFILDVSILANIAAPLCEQSSHTRQLGLGVCG